VIEVMERAKMTPQWINETREMMKDAEARIPDLRQSAPSIHADLDALLILLRRFEIIKVRDLQRN